MFFDRSIARIKVKELWPSILCLQREFRNGRCQNARKTEAKQTVSWIVFFSCVCAYVRIIVWVYVWVWV